MKFQGLRDFLSASGGRKFLMTIGAGIVDSLLVMHGHITTDAFVELTKWTVSAYILGNVLPTVKDIFRRPISEPTK